MSLKDRGNEQVKKGNHEKAIECYLKYVDEDHQDNPAAYTNLALCYFKLKEYRKCIEACENSLLQNRENAKAYYRLYMAYKEIPGQDYQTFINAHLFLKHYHEENQSSKSEAIKIMREFKQRFTKKNIQEDVKISEEIINDLEIMGNQSIRRSFENEPEDLHDHWSKYFQDPNFTLEQKMQKVKDVILNQHQTGLNLAYLFLNMTNDYESQNYISGQIALAKKEYFSRQGISMPSQVQVAQEQTFKNYGVKNEYVDDSDENLFESESEKDKKHNKQESTCSASKQSIKKQQSPVKSTITYASSPPTINPNPQQPLTTQTIQSQYQKFMSTHKQSHDILADLCSIICQILRSGLPQEGKRGYLKQIQGRVKDIGLLKFSLTQRQNKQLFELLQANGLEKQFKFCKPI